MVEGGLETEEEFIAKREAPSAVWNWFGQGCTGRQKSVCAMNKCITVARVQYSFAVYELVYKPVYRQRNHLLRCVLSKFTS